MNTLVDLETMKKKHDNTFGTSYKLLITELITYYVSEMNGIDRIRHELEVWNDDAGKYIINDLLTEISKIGVGDFKLKQ